VLRLETSVTYKGSPVAALPAWPSGFGDQNTPASYAAALIDYQFNTTSNVCLSKDQQWGHDKRTVALGRTAESVLRRHFHPRRSQQCGHGHAAQSDRQSARCQASQRVVGAAVGNLHGPTVERVFVGPKALDVLESVQIPGITGTNPDLRGLVDFGWWGILARPLFLWLKWTYNHLVHNWDGHYSANAHHQHYVAALRIAQMKSMLKMQRVAPQIKSIQEKYKKYSLRDPRKAAMNEEVAALYKKEGVNPAGGCLPC